MTTDELMVLLQMLPEETRKRPVCVQVEYGRDVDITDVIPGNTAVTIVVADWYD